MEKIKMVDLAEQFETARQFMITPPEQLLESGQYIGGPHVGEFEEAWAKHCGVEHAIGVSSGTDALTACYQAIVEQHKGPRMRIITQANTFVATATAALRIQDMTVEFIDCDEYFGMSIPHLHEVLERTKNAFDLTIVVPVHMYGIMCDMVSICHIASRYPNVFVVEDASHAHGSTDMYHRRAGSYSDCAAFSCFPAKPLGAAGDAGIVVTNQASYADYVRSYINCGRGDNQDTYANVGFTYRMDAIQAIVLRAKLRLLSGWRAKREHVAKQYFEHLKGIEGVRLPWPRPTCGNCAWYAFPLRVPMDRRTDFQQCLFEEGIPFKRYYARPASDEGWMGREHRAYAVSSLENSRLFSKQNVCLPIHEFLTGEQQGHIINVVKEFFE